LGNEKVQTVRGNSDSRDRPKAVLVFPDPFGRMKD
jgi:hypothetical protein